MSALRSCTVAILAAAALLTPALATSAPQHELGAADAISLAQRASSGGWRGVYVLEVQSTGHADDFIFLNSEADYHDARNVAVRLEPSSFASLRRRYGPDLESAFRGKTIQVDGMAKQVTIYFLQGGHSTGRAYYQTHIPVQRADQLKVLPTS